MNIPKRNGLKQTPLKRKPSHRKPPLKKTPKSLLNNSPKKPRKSNGLRIRIDPLDALFSEFIRRRAVKRVGGCERCLTPHRWQDLENSHFFGRADQSTRFDETNCSGLCTGCHFYLGGHPNEHRRWFIAKIGEQEFSLLEGRNRILGKPDRKAIEIYLRAKIKELGG